VDAFTAAAAPVVSAGGGLDEKATVMTARNASMADVLLETM
jgi:hypothetical protein